MGGCVQGIGREAGKELGSIGVSDKAPLLHREKDYDHQRHDKVRREAYYAARGQCVVHPGQVFSSHPRWPRTSARTYIHHGSIYKPRFSNGTTGGSNDLGVVWACFIAHSEPSQTVSSEVINKPKGSIAHFGSSWTVSSAAINKPNGSIAYLEPSWTVS